MPTNGAAHVEPPADLKIIIDKTAAFVARNGPEFETRIKNEQNNTKFTFLQPNDPFHAYYRAKVVELGGSAMLSSTAGGRSAELSAAPTVFETKKAPAITPIEPPRLMHLGVKPIGANPLDLDVIQLTAQYVACNGRSFLTGIANRESKNPQFDFLKPTHHLFTHFLCRQRRNPTIFPALLTDQRSRPPWPQTALVDSYSKCLVPTESLPATLRGEGAEPLRTLTRVQSYAAFVRERDRAKLTREQQIEEEVCR